MSALGQKQTSDWRPLMSALLPKADIDERDRHVRFVPEADSCTATNSGLFDHLVGAILLEQNEVGRQRARYMTLETIAPLGDDPIVSFPTIAS
jgi:hypothetical protein